MKKIIYLTITISSLALHGQVKGKFRTDLNAGLLFPSAGGLGMCINLEPKYNLASNMSVGLRFSNGTAVQGIDPSSRNLPKEELSTVVGALLGTCDYYFNRWNTSTIPFIGAGLGYYSIIHGQAKAGTSLNDFEHLDRVGKWGGLFRIGIETGKFRIGVDYQLIPKTKIQSINGSTLGSQPNNYFTIHFGLFIGGGKWKKPTEP